MASKWRSFKKALTKHIHTYKIDLEHLSKPPILYSFLEQRHWDSFLKDRLSENFEVHISCVELFYFLILFYLQMDLTFYIYHNFKGIKSSSTGETE